LPEGEFEIRYNLENNTEFSRRSYYVVIPHNEKEENLFNAMDNFIERVANHRLVHDFLNDKYKSKFRQQKDAELVEFFVMNMELMKDYMTDIYSDMLIEKVSRNLKS